MFCRCRSFFLPRSFRRFSFQLLAPVLCFVINIRFNEHSLEWNQRFMTFEYPPQNVEGRFFPSTFSVWRLNRRHKMAFFLVAFPNGRPSVWVAFTSMTVDEKWQRGELHDLRFSSRMAFSTWLSVEWVLEVESMMRVAFHEVSFLNHRIARIAQFN